MIIRGSVEDGKVVPDEPMGLPDGSSVRILIDREESAFWKDKTLVELAEEQGVSDVGPMGEAQTDWWPPEESVDDFLDWLREIRK